ncbi:hypothetical protein ARSEF1564_008885 [Beauveria bassiana]
MMNAADVVLDDLPIVNGEVSETAFSSPALPSSLNFDGIMSSSACNLATVSPQDRYPLFHQESSTSEATNADDSVNQGSDSNSVGQTSNNSKRRPSGSPTSGSSHAASLNVRERDKPLPPIIVEDPHDVTAIKRARNTLAARKSRERKALRFNELKDQIAELKAERDHWKNIALS